MRFNKKIISFLSFATLFLVLGTENAYAGGCGGAGIGSIICNVIENSAEAPSLFDGIAYLMGALLGIWGIFKFREHVESPNQVQIWDPIKRMGAGGAMFALPTVMTAAKTAITGGAEDPHGGSNFNGGAAGGQGLDAMLVALLEDIWTPLNILLSGFGYFAGIILIMIAISRMLKSEQDGPRGPTGLGTAMTVALAGALFAFSHFVGGASNSLFDAPGTNTGTLIYTAGMTGAEIGHANAVIGAIVAFVAILGLISVMRGLFLLRGVSEGSQQASVMAATTHIIGGAIAVNLGPMMVAVQNTLGIPGLGLGIAFG